MDLTAKAFDEFRLKMGQARLPPHELVKNPDELRPMCTSDGLQAWTDGPCRNPVSARDPPSIAEHRHRAHLWVVRVEDVVHANERCEFGATLETGVIKHTNLTGGAAAHSGGELIFLDPRTIVLNGRSGRYGPRSREELQQVARAFAQSGYGVWCMGYDEDTGAIGFGGDNPEWIT